VFPSFCWCSCHRRSPLLVAMKLLVTPNLPLPWLQLQNKLCKLYFQWNSKLERHWYAIICIFSSWIANQINCFNRDTWSDFRSIVLSLQLLFRRLKYEETSARWNKAVKTQIWRSWTFEGLSLTYLLILMFYKFDNLYWRQQYI